FSSRRRHTRFSRDWSSDVCSSDLPADRLQRHAGGPAAQPPHRDPRAALRNQRAPMRRILDILTSRWCVTLLAALVLALLVWFAGPWIGFGEPAWYPLASPVARLVIILVVVLAWGAGNLIGQARVRQANRELVEDLKPDPEAEAVAGEQAELARSFERALARLGN